MAYEHVAILGFLVFFMAEGLAGAGVFFLMDLRLVDFMELLGMDDLWFVNFMERFLPAGEKELVINLVKVLTGFTDTLFWSCDLSMFSTSVIRNTSSSSSSNNYLSPVKHASVKRSLLIASAALTHFFFACL